MTALPASGRPEGPCDRAHLALPAELSADLLTALSHELRTPLASIVGYAEILTGEDTGLDRTTARMMQAVRRNADRMARVLDNLSALADLDRGHIPRWRTPVDLAAVLADLAAMVADEAAQLRVALAVRPLTELPAVLGDPTTLRQAIVELTLGAVTGTDEGGRVEVAGATPARPPATAELVITTVGAARAGGPPIGVRRIGTSAAHGIITAHGGRVRTSATADGTRTVVELPAAG